LLFSEPTGCVDRHTDLIDQGKRVLKLSQRLGVSGFPTRAKYRARAFTHTFVITVRGVSVGAFTESRRNENGKS
jgi:hypothetical protein